MEIDMEKKVCSRCIYDEDTPHIEFDEEGVCNYCRTQEQLDKDYPAGPDGEARLRKVAEEIKKAGKGKKYDCVVGVSGGCDSSYMVHYIVKNLGLRPLAVHFDNTWNSTIATKNINCVLGKLGVDLWTYVVDNKEYDDIYRSFLEAGVPDIDVSTDIALAATLNMAAEKYGVKYVVEGHNFRTEGVAPLGWVYMDGKYISSVHKRFGKIPLRTYPNMMLPAQLRWMVVNRIQKIRPLWYLSYDKEDVKKFLSAEYGWEWYGGHHLENRFTAFAVSYFYPKRFGIDLRMLGYAAACRTGRMTREEAAAKLAEPAYLEPELLEYVKKRLGYGDADFNRVMNLPKKTYRDYPTYKKTFERMRPFFWLMAKLNLIPMSFYMKYTKKQD
jgi:N-acetyl sugar amidotransferase